MSYFDGIKVGDRVWDFIYGWGVVYEVRNEYLYPITVDFSSDFNSYNMDGEGDKSHFQVLFWNEFKVPEEAHKRLK
jgi:hypothetical protein